MPMICLYDFWIIQVSDTFWYWSVLNAKKQLLLTTFNINVGNRVRKCQWIRFVHFSIILTAENLWYGTVCNKYTEACSLSPLEIF